MPHFISPIVGAYYRPPASTILAYLPMKFPLTLDPEPTNEYDSNAIRVILNQHSLQGFLSDLETDEETSSEVNSNLFSSGWSLEQLAELDELHLGYIPRTHNTQLLDLLSQPSGNFNWSATYTTLLDGKPAVRVDFAANTNSNTP